MGRQKIGLMMIILLGLIGLGLSGCAKHGFMMETDKNYKGETSIGWGPMSIVETSAAGAVKMCIPGKETIKGDPTNNWCRSWMETPPGGGE